MSPQATVLISPPHTHTNKNLKGQVKWVGLQKTEEPSALSIWPNLGENVAFTVDVIILDKTLCLPIKLPHNKLLNPSWSAISPPTSTHFQTQDSAITGWASLVWKNQRRDSELGPFQIMKYLHAQIAVLGKDPSLNLKCVSYTPYTQILKITSYSPFRDLYFSCDPSQGTGVEFSTHSVQRAQKVSDFQFSELRGLTSTKHPLSTRGAQVFRQ